MTTRFRFPPQFTRLDRSVLAAAIALGLTTSALAGDGRPEFPLSVAEAGDRAEARFQTLDADRSGEVSLAEFTEAAPELRERGGKAQGKSLAVRVRLGLFGQRQGGAAIHRRLMPLTQEPVDPGEAAMGEDAGVRVVEKAVRRVLDRVVELGRPRRMVPGLGELADIEKAKPVRPMRLKEQVVIAHRRRFLEQTLAERPGVRQVAADDMEGLEAAQDAKALARLAHRPRQSHRLIEGRAHPARGIAPKIAGGGLRSRCCRRPVRLLHRRAARSASSPRLASRLGSHHRGPPQVPPEPLYEQARCVYISCRRMH